MDKIILYGNGSAARVAYYNFQYDSHYQVAGFTVDSQYLKEQELFGLPVVPFDQVHTVFPADEYGMHIAVGYLGVNQVRAARFQQARELGYRLVNFISSGAVIGEDVEIGENCSIGVNTVVHPFVKIGDNVFIGANSFVGHDSIIEDHCYISDCVTIAGSVKVEPYCFLGIKSTIRNKVRLARSCVVGTGALILQDTNEKEVYLGKPADLLTITSDELPVQ